MSEQPPVPATNTFERIKRVSPEGYESWSARGLARVLEYSEFRHFQPVIEKAQEACLKSKHSIEDHFERILDMVNIGSGAQRPVEDWKLSRHACYLVIQNADPTKPLVALGQTYFAVRTRRQELADDAANSHIICIACSQFSAFQLSSPVPWSVMLPPCCHFVAILLPFKCLIYNDVADVATFQTISTCKTHIKALTINVIAGILLVF